MMKSSTLVIAMLLVTGGAAWAGQAKSATPGPDCEKVFHAKTDAGKSVSSKQLARDLNMPVADVNTCLRRLRHRAPRATPQPAQ